MHLDSKSLSDLTRFFDDELAPKTGRTPVRAFRTKAEAIARIQKCLSELEEAPGFRRMKENLGADGAEALRRQVLQDQAGATALARQDVSTSACASTEAASTGAPERAGEWFDARSHGLEMLSKQALLAAYN